MKITVNGGPEIAGPRDISFRKWVKAWLQLTTKTPERKPIGQLKMIDTEVSGTSGGHPIYRVTPGPNGHVWNPVRKGLRLTWEYAGTTFMGGCKCEAAKP